MKVTHSLALGNSSGIVLASNTALQLEGNVAIGSIPLTLRYNGVANTDGALRSLSGNNTYAGDITLAASSRIQADAGTLTLSGTIARDSGSRALDFYVHSNAHIIVSGTIGALGTGEVEKYLTGVLTLSGNNTFTSGLNINNGTVYLTSIANSNVPSAAGAGGVIRLGLGTTSGTLVYIGNGDSSDRRFEIGDNISGTARTGAGTIQNDGTGPLVFTNPSFNITNRNTSTAPLRFLTLSGSNADANEIQGIIANNGINTAIGLRKEGTGRWILSGQNTYTGPTIVNSGTLVVNGAILNSFVTNNVFGTIAGTGFVANLTIISGTLSPGTSVGTLTAGNLTLLGTPTLHFELGPTNASDLVVVNGTLSFSNMETNWFLFSALPGFGLGTYTLFDAGSLAGTLGPGTNFINIGGSGYDGYLFLEGTDGKLEGVPETSTAALVATGLAILLVLRRRR
ncbi:MAG: autotransporter-associated beta strand repeat-containing protein [Verrucomicrobiae bacterium]|nr:autotransporter-associated beta strand repeat-containing protein [Verrucomicrobiae bacterium]